MVRSRRIPLFAFVIAACRGSTADHELGSADEDPIVSVPMATVEQRRIPETLQLTATLMAGQHSDVAANAPGRVLAAPVERGQTVAQGDLLIQLDGRLAKFAAQAASAQVRLAQAQRELASLECDRADYLLTSGTISQTEYDRTLSQCETTRQSVAAAQSSAAVATVQAGDTVIYAPFAGTIVERYVDVGEYVQPGTKVLTLVALDPIRALISVPQTHAADIAAEQPVSISVDGLGTETFPGTIRYISPTLRETTRELAVEALVPNPEHRLRPGMFASAQLTIGAQMVPAVPAQAVVHEGERFVVWRVQDGRAVRQLVRPGPPASDGAVTIVAGLAAGDPIIENPPETLRDGTRVQ